MKKHRNQIPLQVRQELWRRNVTTWLLEEHQEEIFKSIVCSDVNIAYLDLTRRGGKTFTFACIADYFCRAIPNSYIKYGAAFQGDLKRFIRPAFNTLLEDCPEHLRPRYHIADSSYIYPNGSVIELIGIDKNPDKLRGNRITIMIFDECGYIDSGKLEDVWLSVVIPATTRRIEQMGDPIKLLIGSTPPKSAKAHYAHKLKLKAQAEGYYHKKTLDQITSIPPEEKERLYKEMGGRSSNKARREFGCEWITDEDSALMPTFDESKHVRTIDTLPPIYHCITGGDCAAKRDLTVFHIIAYDWKRDKYCVLDERWYPTKTPAAVWKPEVIKMEQSQTIKPKLRVIDMSEERRLDLTDFPCIAPDKKPGSKDAMLQFIRDLFYKDKIEIDPKCELLIQTLSSHLINKNGTDFERNDLTGHGDAYDSMAYALDYLSKQPIHQHPNPQTHQAYPEQKHKLLKLGHQF